MIDHVELKLSSLKVNDNDELNVHRLLESISVPFVTHLRKVK